MTARTIQRVPCRGGCGAVVRRFVALEWAFCADCTRAARTVSRAAMAAAGIQPMSPEAATFSNRFESSPANYLAAIQGVRDALAGA